MTAEQLIARMQELLDQAREADRVPAARLDVLNEADQVLEALRWEVLLPGEVSA